MVVGSRGGGMGGGSRGGRCGGSRVWQGLETRGW